jgi:DNA-binding NarL/FixJ family response regulator
VFACIEAGAIGYVHKDARPADIEGVIEQVRQGGSPISPMIARKVLARLRRNNGDTAHKAETKAMPEDDPALTPREAEVLQLIAKGFSYTEVGQHLGLSLATIQSHVRSIYGKLEVHSRGEAVFEASRRGLLDGWHA